MTVRLSPNRPASASVIVPVALLLITCLGLSGCDKVNGAPPTDPSDTVYHHLAQPMRLQQQSGYQIKRRLSGRVQVQQNASLGFEQAGKLARLLVDEGDQVARGALLAEQDDSLLKIERQELQAQLREVNARLELTDKSLKRIHSLKKRGFSSDQQLDELRAQRKVQLASRLRTQAALDANQSRLDKTHLYAPFDGRISQRFIDQGVVVAPGNAVFQLMQQGSSEVEVGVPVRLLDSLESPQSHLSLDGKEIPLQVLGRSPDMDPITRTVQVRFALPATTQAVNGQLAQLHIEENFNRPGYWVPLDALTDGIRGMWTVYQMKAVEADQGQPLYRLEQRNVRVLHATEKRAFISGALQDGDLILAAGLHRLVPGQTVRIQSPEQLAVLTGEAP